MNKYLLSRPKRVILSKLEADILAICKQEAETYIPDLGVELKLPPDQILEGISKLEGRGFAVREENKRIRITEEGIKVAIDLSRKPTSQFRNLVRIMNTND